MNLNQTILNAARDEVAKKYDYDNWQEVEESIWTGQRDSLRDESTELAMEKQAGFLLWTFWMDWIYSDGRFMNSKSGDVLPELELYNIWREGK